MKFESRRAIHCAMGTMVLCLLGTPWARSQSANAGANQKPQMSEEAFKNIQVLRGIPVNEFMGTMGFFAASLGMNCTDCHVKESAGNWDRYADDTPLKQTARRMVLMENLINRSDFGAVRDGDLLHLPSRRPAPRGHAEPGRAVRSPASG